MFFSSLIAVVCMALVDTILIQVPTISNNVLSKIISSLDDYCCVVKHFEFSTNMYEIFDNNYYEKTTEVFNYDLMEKPRFRGANSSKKKINVFAFSSEKYFKMLEEEMNGVTILDAAIIINGFKGITPDYVLDNFFYLRHVYVYDVSMDLLSYCEYNTAKFCNMKNVSTSGEVSQTLKAVPRNIVTLNNMTFKVGYRHHYTNFEYRFEHGKIIIKGLEAELLKILSQKLQFNYELISYPENTTAGKTETIIKHIFSDDIDWAVGGIVRNVKRVALFDFTRYIKIDGYKILFGIKHRTSNFYSCDENNNAIKYQLTVTGCCCIVTFFMYLSTVIIRRKESDFSKDILAVLSPLYDQSFQIKFMTKSAKAIFALWCFCAIVICNYFKVASLLDLLVKGGSYTTIEELLKADYKFVITDGDFLYIKNNCDNTSSDCSDCAKVLNRSETTTDLCPYVQRIFDEPLAIVGDKTILENWVWNICKDVLTPEQTTEMKFTSDNLLGLTWKNWPFRKFSFLPKLFSKHFIKIEASGILQYKTKQNLRKNVKVQGVKALQMINVASPFKLLLVGHTLSTVVFFLEVIIFKKRY